MLPIYIEYMYAKERSVAIESLYQRYHRPEYLGIDPLCIVRRYVADPREAEVAGLVAAVLSYGRVERIIASIETVLSLMELEPLAFVTSTPYRSMKKRFAGVVHRFNSGTDIAMLCAAIGDVLREYGSLNALFVSGMDATEDIAVAMNHFSTVLRLKGRLHDRDEHPYFEYLLPAPSSGSACKRMCMYVRWMVRENDGIDLGAWQGISPALLQVPVDTHVLRIAQGLGMTKRRSADWRTSAEITASLRKICMADPVKYDFSLCRQGMTALRGEIS